MTNTHTSLWWSKYGALTTGVQMWHIRLQPGYKSCASDKHRSLNLSPQWSKYGAPDGLNLSHQGSKCGASDGLNLAHARKVISEGKCMKVISEGKQRTINAQTQLEHLFYFDRKQPRMAAMIVQLKLFTEPKETKAMTDQTKGMTANQFEKWLDWLIFYKGLEYGHANDMALCTDVSAEAAELFAEYQEWQQ